VDNELQDLIPSAQADFGTGVEKQDELVFRRGYGIYYDPDKPAIAD